MAGDNIPSGGGAGGNPLITQSIADIATTINGASTISIPASYFDNMFDAAESASIFDSVNLTAAKLTSIYNHTNLTIQKAQEIMDAQATPEKSTIEAVQDSGTASAGDATTLTDATKTWNVNDWTDFILAITGGTGIGQYRIISSNTATALTVSANWATNTDATSTYEIRSYRIGFMGDDWVDNKLTSRDNAATTATSLTKIFQHFRPAWTQVTGTTAVTGGEVVLDEDGEKITTPSTFTVGTWEIGFTDITTSLGFGVFIIMETGAGRYQIAWRQNGDAYDIRTDDTTSILHTAWGGGTDPHIAKVTRDGSGNFELFRDGVSQGTVTNTDLTTSDTIGLKDYTGGTTHYDNLKVY